MHAKYCDQFAHVTWPDGTIRHVFITPEIHRYIHLIHNYVYNKSFILEIMKGE